MGEVWLSSILLSGFWNENFVIFYYWVLGFVFFGVLGWGFCEFFVGGFVGRVRKGLEKLRAPSATELLLSNDGDRILEGSTTNFFVVCRRVSSCFILFHKSWSSLFLPMISMATLIKKKNNDNKFKWYGYLDTWPS